MLDPHLKDRAFGMVVPVGVEGGMMHLDGDLGHHAGHLGTKGHSASAGKKVDSYHDGQSPVPTAPMRDRACARILSSGQVRKQSEGVAYFQL